MPPFEAEAWPMVQLAHGEPAREPGVRQEISQAHYAAT